MEVELKKINNKKKIISIITLILLILVVIIGGSSALFSFSKSLNNQSVIAGDIYMKASSNKVITASVTPMSTKEGMEKGEKYNFSVEGYNDSKKDIYYGIYINYGEEQENKQRFNDEDIMIYLTETKNGEKKDVFGPGRLSDFNNNMIYASTIDANIKKEDKVTRDYELTVWLSDNVLISDTETNWEGKNIYTSEEYKNSYLSLDVKVEGDFVEKGVTDGKVEITVVTATSNTPYDLTTSPESDEDVKIILTSTKELEKIILINTNTSEKEELTPTENKVEKVISASGKYRYYGIFKDGKISATEEFIVNLLSDKTTTLNKPTNKICIERVYNGDTQELAESTKGYTLENNTGLNVNTYQVKVKLNEGYTWSDETTDDVTIECEIKPKDVELEWSVGNYTYTGDPQGPTATAIGVKDEVLTIETTKETDAGSHVSTATLTKVTNGQEEIKNYNLTNNTKDYEIEKAIPELTLEPVSGSVRVNGEVTFKATSNVEGTFKVTSSASSKATATLTPSTGKTTTVTVSGKELGDANIEVQFESTNPNYSSNKKTYQVTVTEGIQEATPGSCKEDLIYNGESQTLINEGVGVTYNKTAGTNAGDYQITVTPKDGYEFSDGKTTQTLTCTIKQKDLTITAKDQTISYGSSISTGTSYITTGDNELVSGHSVYSVSLSQSTSSITSSGTITPSSAVIKAGTSSSSTTVTSNYNITYVKGNLKITQASAGFRFSEYSGSVYVGNQITFTASANVSGTFSVRSTSTNKVDIKLSSTSGTSITVTLTGVTVGTGTVYIDFTPTSSNYASDYWSYNVTVNNKLTPTLNLNPTSGSVNVGSSVTFTASTNVTGTFSVSSSASGTAIATVPTGAGTSKTVTVSGVALGTAYIYVYFYPTSSSYSNISKTYTITVKKSYPESAQKVLDKAESSSCNPIIEDTDGTIYFSGTNDCINFNYVWYSGKLWRITSINPDGSMKLVTDTMITTINWGENTTYEGSWIYQWLNEDFKDTLYNYQDIIVQNADWNATEDETAYGSDPPVQKPPTDSSATIVQGDVGLLNAYEYLQAYKNASESTNYLNIGYYWYLITPYSSREVRFVYSSGYFTTHNSSVDPFGVRPSINLKSNITLTGQGTKSSPYTISSDKTTGKTNDKINTRMSGEYVQVDNKVYRIVGIENGTTKLTSVDYVRDENGAVLKKEFGSNVSWATSVTNDDTDNYWSYYLNNTWLTSELRKYISEGTYYLGEYPNVVSYKNTICSSSNTISTTKNCSKTGSTWTGLVGLPRVGEMFSAQLSKVLSEYMWLITPFDNSSVNVLRSYGIMTFNTPGEVYCYATRPSINLKSTVYITGGSGTESSPYTVGVPSSSPNNQEGPSIVDENVGTNKTASIGSCNNLVYNGEEQTLVSGGKNVTYSNNKGTDAGTYTVTVNTKNGYFFSDGTTSKTLTCTIEKKAVTVNYSNNEVKYTGGLVSPIATATGVKGENIELETTKESSIGDYTMITTMKNVNPNYTLRNTVYDYKIVDGNVKNNNDIKTTYKVNYYLMNKDNINYTLVKSNSYDAKVGESVTGKILEFSGYKSPKSITIEIIKGLNIINYYYEKES